MSASRPSLANAGGGFLLQPVGPAVGGDRVEAEAVEKGLNQFGTAANWLSFEGVPLRKVDALLNTEARVV